MPATLKVTHEAIGAEVRRGTYDVVVDGERAGSVELHGTFEAPVKPGRHTLKIRNGRNYEPVANFAEPPARGACCPNCQCRACWTGFGSSCATACRTNSCWNASPSGVAARRCAETASSSTPNKAPGDWLSISATSSIREEVSQE